METLLAGARLLTPLHTQILEHVCILTSKTSSQKDKGSLYLSCISVVSMLTKRAPHEHQLSRIIRLVVTHNDEREG